MLTSRSHITEKYVVLPYRDLHCAFASLQGDAQRIWAYDIVHVAWDIPKSPASVQTSNRNLPHWCGIHCFPGETTPSYVEHVDSACFITTRLPRQAARMIFWAARSWSLWLVQAHRNNKHIHCASPPSKTTTWFDTQLHQAGWSTHKLCNARYCARNGSTTQIAGTTWRWLSIVVVAAEVEVAVAAQVKLAAAVLAAMVVVLLGFSGCVSNYS